MLRDAPNPNNRHPSEGWGPANFKFRIWDKAGCQPALA